MVYVILPVYNRARVTARFLRALVSQTFTNYKLILVDDGCTDDTVAVARSLVPPERLTILAGSGQLWWAGALQMAYLHLRSLVQPDDRILISNDDIDIDPTFLEAGVALLDRYPGACIQAMGVDVDSGTLDRGTIMDARRLRFRSALVGETSNCLATRGLIMSAATFIRSGGFKPRLLPHYLSDYEFTVRLARQGVELRCDPQFKAGIHMELTGQSDYVDTDLRSFWTAAFSNRAKYNPLHWTAFVMLVCPAWIAPLHIVKIWLRFLREMGRAAHLLPRKERHMKSAADHE